MTPELRCNACGQPCTDFESHQKVCQAPIAVYMRSWRYRLKRLLLPKCFFQWPFV